MRAACALLLLSASHMFAALGVVQPLIARFDGGPAVPAGTPFGSGESLFLTFDISGFKIDGDEDKRLHVTWECRAVDGEGIPLALPQKGEVKAYLNDEDKLWRPRVRLEIVMPQSLPSGTAEIRIAAKDVFAGTEASLAVPFQLFGLDIERVTALQPLRFRFLRSEDSPEPLDLVAYQQGDTVWAKFEMAGYKLGEENAFHVSYGLEVFRASGESLYKQEVAADEQGKSFYPRRYLTGVLSLKLTRDLARGEYTIALRLKDHIGGTESETRHKFGVE